LKEKFGDVLMAKGGIVTLTDDLTQDLMELKQKLQLLEDKEAIRDVISRYAFAADLGRYDDFVGNFSDEGVWRVTGFDVRGNELRGEFAGRDQLMATISSPGHAAMVNNEQHLLVNFLIDVKGDTASAIGHLVQTLRWRGGFGIGTCRMVKVALGREDGEWRIVEIEFCEIGADKCQQVIGDSGLLSSRQSVAP
jgi:hypothetical protein